ncbi:BTAD domain-containing putative transcriptional regulator [Streptomyces sp. NPDC086091]|uniref:AfsR/SARP family transcriptional regulator n=1 Tax=Streptomyces sp. NPDC086091 TaxID=3365751 RepID=UPI003823DA96
MPSPLPRFRLLGPLEIEIDRRKTALTGRQRALCAVLLLHADHVVSVDRMIRSMWGEQRPGASEARVRALVAEVRRAFGAAGSGLLVTQRPGYALRVAPAEVDVHLFEQRLGDAARSAAHGDWAEAYRCHAAALTLWRSDPLPDLPAMEAERRRLTELYVAAREGRAEADMELGRHRPAVAELIRLTSDHPLRERPHALLMHALQRDGRTADALAVYTELRRRMVDELGVEPSDEIASLHQKLLRGDVGPQPSPGPGRGLPPEHLQVPRQLPRGPRRFVGRNAQLRLLDAGRRQGEELTLVVGPAGVGKTALALHWAHRIAGDFPDGQLFLDMRGFDDAEPMTPQEALPLLLQGLGCASRDIPLRWEAQAALYRTVLAERRILVVLDDVADASYVRDLLPASNGSLTLVTSRHRLNGLVTLDGAFRVSCDVLDSGEALELISSAVGADAVEADQESATRLVELCDRLPLALCVASSWIGDGPGSIRDYVRDLAERGRLARLHVEGEESVAVRAALDLSYAGLPAEAKRAFRLLGLVAGTGRSSAAAAAAAGIDEPRMSDLLRLAHRVHLLRDAGGGRSTWHDLVHEYARDRAVAEDAEVERRAAVLRVLDHYLQSVVNVARVCGFHVPWACPPPVERSVPREFGTQEDAYAWFASEWEDIAAAITHAAEHGPSRFAWQLVDALLDLFHHRRPMSDWIRLATVAREAAERSGDLQGQSAMKCSTGNARWRNGDLKGALSEYEEAEILARRAGWLFGEAAALQGRGVTLKILGKPQEVPPLYRRCLDIYRQLGVTKSTEIMLINLASLYHCLGRLPEAEHAVTEALSSLVGESGRHTHSMALVNLALVLQQQARFAEALDALWKCFLVSRDSGSVYGEAVALETLGRVFTDAGHSDRAIQAYEDALELSRRVGNRNCEVDSLVGLAVVKVRISRPDDADRHLDDARDIAERTGHRTGLVEMLLAQATVCCTRGAYADAIRHLEHAAQLAVEGTPLALPRIRTLTALALLEAGAVTDALREADKAVAQADDSGQRLALARALMARAAAGDRAGDVRPAVADRERAHILFEEIHVPDGPFRTDLPWESERHVQRRRRRYPTLPSDADSRCDLYLVAYFEGFEVGNRTSS